MNEVDRVLRQVLDQCARHEDPRVRATAMQRAEILRRELPSYVAPAPRELPMRHNPPDGVFAPMPQHRPELGRFVQAIMAPTKVLTVPDVPVVAAGTVSTQAILDLSSAGMCDDGWLIAMNGSVRDDTNGVEAAGQYELASIAVQANINDNELLFTDGVGAAFVRYADMFAATGDRPYPLLRRVTSADRIVFTWQNQQPAATGNDLSPSLSFEFLRLPKTR